MPRRNLRYKALFLKDYLPSLSLTNPPDKALLLGFLTGIGWVGLLDLRPISLGGNVRIVFSFHDPFSKKKKAFGVNKTYTAQG